MKYWLTLVCALIGVASLARGQIMTADGFEEGSFDLWRLQTWGALNKGSIAEPPVPFEGVKAFRAVASPRAAAEGQNWCEIGRYFAKSGDERWWGFAVFFPDDWVADSANCVLSQVHSIQDKEQEEATQAPMLVLRVEGEKMIIESRWDDSEVSQPERYGVGGSIANNRIYEGPLVRGKWITWVFHARFSSDPAGNGLVEAWRDGEQVASHDGPNTYNNTRNMTIRVGLYKRFYKELAGEGELAAYFDHFVIGDQRANYATVEPRTDPLAARGSRPDAVETLKTR